MLPTFLVIYFLLLLGLGLSFLRWVLAEVNYTKRERQPLLFMSLLFAALFAWSGFELTARVIAFIL